MKAHVQPPWLVDGHATNAHYGGTMTAAQESPAGPLRSPAHNKEEPMAGAHGESQGSRSDG